MTRSLRLWPGLIGGAILVARLLMPYFVADAGLAVLVGVVGALIVLVWWLFLSRAPWSERLLVLVMIALLMYLASRGLHPSISGGMMGMMFPIYSLPTVCLALVAWATLTQTWSATPRRLALVAAVFVGAGAWTLLRTDGILGGAAQLQWRWTPTAEETLLARAPEAPQPLPPPEPAPVTTPVVPEKPSAAPDTPAEWPGFRGPDRDSVVRNLRIDTDWSSAPPKELWRKPIGPGWSSFAVQGDVIYTQEQRGDDEVVSAYRLSSGAPVWMHKDRIRFYESNGGPGPRATPVISRGRVYTLGATGLLNALDARTGAVVWSRNAADATGTTLPGWGFSGSPIVVDDLVVVATSGKLGAFDVASGTPRWIGPAGLGGYSSPHLMTIGGVRQIVLLHGSGAISVSPADGKALWQHDWSNGGAVIAQPARLADDEVLVNGVAMTGGMGVRRLKIAHASNSWSAEEKWTSNGLKPYFNDFVIHEGHAYGFDGSILACIDLADGKRKWKGGRYGEGQLVLIADQDLLLVVSEEGELALVNATPDKYAEVAKVKAIEGKTWNHPVVVGDVLLVRNGEEMAAFRLARAK